ncbi:hypothetical protein [Streptococcus sp. CSL10205-OR2]|uniref:hypothetical protein n=1 Tax=Streptococcus sp. CSL10205-OR2 TaxID=2980558 RepID=UPI0021D90954|nr:hypothetical protein [Streptococcus sp. CSL10205-OR2]MCU9534323.1 hypothetical protein [Streptococcus sp. CSL10205-OR2]
MMQWLKELIFILGTLLIVYFVLKDGMEDERERYKKELAQKKGNSIWLRMLRRLFQ